MSSRESLRNKRKKQSTSTMSAAHGSKDFIYQPVVKKTSAKVIKSNDNMTSDSYQSKILSALKKLNLSNSECENITRFKMRELEKILSWRLGGMQLQVSDLNILFTQSVSIRDTTEVNVCLVSNLFEDPAQICVLLQLKHFDHTFCLLDYEGFIDFIKYSLRSGPVLETSHYCNNFQFEIIRCSKTVLSPLWVVIRDTHPSNLNTCSEAYVILSDEVWTLLHFNVGEIESAVQIVTELATKCTHILQNIIYKCVTKINFLKSVENICMADGNSIEYDSKILINSIKQLTIDKYSKHVNFKIIHNLMQVNIYEEVDRIANSLYS